MREELDVVDDLHRRGVAALDAEDDHAAEAVLEDLTGLVVAGVVLEAGVANPRHLGVLLEVLGDFESVLAMANHAHRQRFDSLQEQE